MTTMVITGGQVLTPLEARFTNVWIDGCQVEQLSDGLPDKADDVKTLDASGCLVTPGLFDLQVNGGPMCNLWTDPANSDLQNLRDYLTNHGVTSFLPTLITDELEHLGKNIAFLNQQGLADTQGAKTARMPGIHLEGPCLSPQKPGVHPPSHLQPLAPEVLTRLAVKGVSLITIAPELDATAKSIGFLQEKGIKVALGHSNATFEQARQAFASGIGLMTHTFNALPALHHRAAGAVGAALLDKQVSCCVIADGLHVDPCVIEILLRLKGIPKTILVSDAAFTGTSQGGLVGSSITLDQAVLNLVKWGVCGFREAIQMASWNPACALNLQDKIGALVPGALADAVLWDAETLQIRSVVLAGKLWSC